MRVSFPPVDKCPFISCKHLDLTHSVTATCSPFFNLLLHRAPKNKKFSFGLLKMDFVEEYDLISKKNFDWLPFYYLWYSNTFDTGWNSLIGCGAADFIFSGALIVRLNDSVHWTTTRWQSEGLTGRDRIFWADFISIRRLVPESSQMAFEYLISINWRCETSCALTDSLRVSGLHGPEVNPSDRF